MSGTLFNTFKGVAEYFTPVLTDSNFLEKGVLTPEEFVKAGDQLVFTCRTWRWASGASQLAKPYLPKDKQFLTTRVPSLRRANTYALADAKEKQVDDDDGEGGWTATHVDCKLLSSDVKDMEGPNEALAHGLKSLVINDDYVGGQNKPETNAKPAPSLTAPPSSSSSSSASSSSSTQQPSARSGASAPPPPTDDIPDMDEFDEDNMLDNKERDPGTLSAQQPTNVLEVHGDQPVLRAQEPEDTILRTRTYDLSIVYDKYYRTPRIYLSGYDEYRQPLTPEKIMEDISVDHVNKTVTVESHPHLDIPCASIHPCRHAHTMKIMIDSMLEEHKRQQQAVKARAVMDEEVLVDADADDVKSADHGKSSSGNGGGSAEAPPPRISVEQYLFLFLKFVSSVIPTIEYDYTPSV